MNDLGVDKKLKNLYDNSYGNQSIPGWRELCAIDKSQNIMDLCKNIPHSKVLDIGSGEGSIIKRLSSLNFADEFYSLEISESAVNVIQEKKIPALIECRLYDGYHIPYDDMSFDLAIISHVIEHTEYPRMIIKDAARVASHIFIEVPLEMTARLSDNYVWDGVGHINWYSMKSIRRFLQSMDFQIISQRVSDLSYDTYKYRLHNKAFLRYIPRRMLLKISPKLATKIFTYHCAILCKKHI